MEFITPGQLNIRISIKKEISTRDSRGEYIPASSEVSKCWAKQKDLSGNEAIDGKIIEMNVRTYIVRYNIDFVKNGQLYYVVDVDGEYNISQVRMLAHKQYLELKCFKRE